MLVAVIVINRFRLDAARLSEFTERCAPALDLLRTKEGLESLDFGQNLDEPDLWVLVTRWRNVGSYRRALSGMESKMIVVPFLSLSIDEASAYDDPENVGENLPRVR